ncbi:MAG: enoyl-CoA hydratase/isomerase family protein, partial [Kiloniellales bacterium]
MSADRDILFELHGAVGVVLLNRPQALNALTLAMIEAFDRRLRLWAGDPGVAAVLIKGAGERAFCAGGDVRAITRAGEAGEPLTADFFRAEYTLNRRIKTWPKATVAVVDGLAMGGGVGVSVHGSHRVVSERMVMAMPETRIGLFPDVGASYFLSRLPGALGIYLGLTGARMAAADALSLGLATHFVASDRLPALEAALFAADWSGTDPRAVASVTTERFAGDPGVSPLAERRAVIERCFAGESVAAILTALEAEGGDWATQTLADLARCSPTSLKITFEALRRGAGLDFDQVMVMEYRLSQACMAGHDFYEGIRAVVIDKDNAPAWEPDRLEAVTPELVEAHFRSLGAED